MRLVFFGTPEFAVPTLEALLAAGHDVALVLTQPDRAAGRSQQMQAPAVKVAAIAHGIPVLQPDKIKTNEELRSRLQAIAPEVIVVVAYGRIIPPWMLDLPRFGNINLHGSLLPKYRGAAPIQWAIANGEAVTGVTTMHLDPGLDTGDMLLAHTVPIAPEATAPDLFEALASIGADLMVETLSRLADGTITPQPQDHTLATLAPILTREDAAVDFTAPAQRIYDRWRAFQPWPGAHTMLHGRKLSLCRMSLEPRSDPRSLPTAGSILLDGERLLVVCGDGQAICLEELQLEGKRRLAAAEFLRGQSLHTGDRLGV